MVTPYRSPIKLEVPWKGTSEAARGELVLQFEVLAAKRVLVNFPRTDGSPAQGWSSAQMILAVLALHFAGFDRVSGIDHLEVNPGLCAMLRRFELKLLGISRRVVALRLWGGGERYFPSVRSLRDWLDRFHVGGAQDVESKKGHGFHPGVHQAPRTVPRAAPATDRARGAQSPRTSTSMRPSSPRASRSACTPTADLCLERALTGLPERTISAVVSDR